MNDSVWMRLLTVFGPMSIMLVAMGWFINDTNIENRAQLVEYQIACATRVEGHRKSNSDLLAMQSEASDTRLKLVIAMTQDRFNALAGKFDADNELYHKVLTGLESKVEELVNNQSVMVEALTLVSESEISTMIKDVPIKKSKSK